MSAQKSAYALLFATPPALRSEIVRLAFRSPPPQRCSYPLLSLAGSRVGGRTGYGLYTYSARVGGRRTVSTASTREGTVTEKDVFKQPTPTPTADTTALPPAPPPITGRLRRALFRTSLFLVFFAAGFAMAAAPAADTLNVWANPPSDAETLSLFEPLSPNAEDINDHMVNHPLAVKLRAQENMIESRPHLKIPPAMRPHNLTAGTLMGQDKIEVPPLNFQSKGEALPTMVQLSYLGSGLCGHPGIVHGGLLATLLDEGLARACFPALPNKVGVTASLKIDYKMPCPANRYVVLKAHTTKVEGRKAWVEGWIELLSEDGSEGKKLVTAEALFIEPKGAAGMARVYSTQ